MQREAAAGLVAPDDHENFARGGENVRTTMARKWPFHYGTGIGHELADDGNGEWPLAEDERFHEWLELITDDIRYWMPTREPIQGRSQRQVLDELEQQLSFTLFNDDRDSLQMRVDRLDTGLAYAELPPSVTQRLITNVEVFEADEENEVVVHSTFLVRQVRPESGEDAFEAGGRTVCGGPPKAGSAGRSLSARWSWPSRYCRAPSPSSSEVNADVRLAILESSEQRKDLQTSRQVALRD